ncbi:MAG: hypothetical protein JXR95_10345 [Deltaproteobacteria bacterium]|nr:hypothetical protein [Deltaproteobacteria bacterium]
MKSLGLKADDRYFSICGINIKAVNVQPLEFSGLAPVYAKNYEVFHSDSVDYSIELKITQDINFQGTSVVDSFMRDEYLHNSASGWHIVFDAEFRYFRGECLNTLDAWFGALKASLATYLVHTKRGILLHASSGIMNERVYVIPGASGVGKSTAISKIPGKILCDEITGVTLENNSIHVWSTPFGGDIMPSGNTGAPVIFIDIVKDNTDYICSFSGNKEMLIMKSSVFPGGDEEFNLKFLETVAAISRNFNVQTVGATRQAEFWSIFAGREIQNENNSL